MKIVFFGSSDFSLYALQACLEGGHEVALVVTTPDQKKGRGLKVSPTVVAEFAAEKNLNTEKFSKLKDEKALERVRALHPDIFVVSSYGKLIPSSWLGIPKQVALNVHPSLLPKYRGASPLNQPILNGDEATGLSIAEVTKDLDAGDLFYQERIPLEDKIDLPRLSKLLGEISHGAVLAVLRQIEMGTLKRTPQNESESSYAPKLTKEMGRIFWSEPAEILSRKIRGLKPWPGTSVSFRGELLLIVDGEAVSGGAGAKPGALIEIHKDGAIAVATGEGILRIRSVRPAGKKEMSGADFAHGKRLKPGELLV